MTIHRATWPLSRSKTTARAAGPGAPLETACRTARSASPAGDAHPPRRAADAETDLAEQVVHALLQRPAEVDEHGAAHDELELVEGRVLREVVLGEDNVLAELGGEDNLRWLTAIAMDTTESVKVRSAAR